ncbi:hypothetical protein [Nodosilinea nodulosa]|uniref:hypothetical protein n=1 Tax=Nodosilinea nodulosa TaxID=416001 RepID=UPI0002FB3ADF|nr:hypothetical protein [Nodosilinea nodulosa]
MSDKIVMAFDIPFNDILKDGIYDMLTKTGYTPEIMPDESIRNFVIQNCGELSIAANKEVSNVIDTSIEQVKKAAASAIMFKIYIAMRQTEMSQQEFQYYKDVLNDISIDEFQDWANTIFAEEKIG